MTATPVEHVVSLPFTFAMYTTLFRSVLNLRSGYVHQRPRHAGEYHGDLETLLDEISDIITLCDDPDWGILPPPMKVTQERYRLLIDALVNETFENVVLVHNECEQLIDWMRHYELELTVATMLDSEESG